MLFQNLIVQFGTLAGVAAFIASLVNVFKVFGLPDGSAPKVSAGLSLLAFIGLVSLNMFAPEVNVVDLDVQASDLSVAVLYVLGLVVQLGLPAQFHKFLSKAGVPVIGVSNSDGKG